MGACTARMKKMPLDNRDYRDPMLVAEEREARTCQGCEYVGVVRCLGSLHQVCKISPRRTVGKRCANYWNKTEEQSK